jgi:hypothetical protein
MWIFRRGKQYKPTQEQLARLSKITNEDQKRTLLEAIQRGEEIPDYAWTPYPETMNAADFAASLRSGMQTDFDDAIQACAERARLTASKSSWYLCEPFDSNAVSKHLVVLFESTLVADRFKTLCRWGIFNPFGPTTTILTMTPVLGTDEDLISVQVEHPLSQSSTVYGLAPKAVSKNAEQLASVLRHLFKRNGSSEFPLLHDLPSHVVEVPNSPIHKPLPKELFFLVSQCLNIEDLDAAIESLSRYRTQPWERASAEFKTALEKARPTLSGLQNVGEEQFARPAKPVTEVQFERWWSIVTNPQHVQAETSQMDAAREGALSMLRREGRPSF